jgi:hypothetical protein
MSDHALPDEETTWRFGYLAENLLARLSDRHLDALASAYDALAEGMMALSFWRGRASAGLPFLAGPPPVANESPL